MSIEVMMPQMGESVVEGTVTKWLVKEGDRVQEDQPLCEISTDKVDTEIPSPGAGVIAKLIAAEGETLPVGAPLAVIEASGAAAGTAVAAPAAAPAPAGVRTQPKAAPALPPAPGKAAAAGAPSAARPQQPPPTLRAVRSEPRPQAAAVHSASQAPAGGASAPPAGGSGAAAATAEPAAAAAAPRGAHAPRAPGGVAAGAHRRYSPVVIRIAEEHGIDLTRVPGTGIGGRVSKRDVLAYLDALQAGQIQPPASGVTNGATNAARRRRRTPLWRPRSHRRGWRRGRARCPSHYLAEPAIGRRSMSRARATSSSRLRGGASSSPSTWSTPRPTRRMWAPLPRSI